MLSLAFQTVVRSHEMKKQRISHGHDRYFYLSLLVTFRVSCGDEKIVIDSVIVASADMIEGEFSITRVHICTFSRNSLGKMRHPASIGQVW